MESEKNEVQHGELSRGSRLNFLVALVVGLVIGLLGGYFGRPLVAPQTVEPTPISTRQAAAPATGDAAAATLMDAVVAQTRHFRGDPNAPITLVEFGDFQ